MRALALLEREEAGAWIELYSAVQQLPQGDDPMKLTIPGTGEDALIFRGFAHGLGSNIDYVYVPSRNVMVVTSHRTAEEAKLINHIIATLRY